MHLGIGAPGGAFRCGSSVAIPLLAAFTAACQTYTPAPLDLDARLQRILSRPGDSREHARLADALRGADVPVPERFDVRDGVTLAEAEVLALFQNADVRLLRARAGVPRARLEYAGLWNDPVFGFDAAEIVSSGSGSEIGATVGLSLPVSGRLQVQRARAGSNVEAAWWVVLDAEWRLRASLREAWAQWTAAVRRTALLADVVADVERIEELTQRLAAAGALRAPDAQLLRMELVGRRADRTAAELDAQRARLRILGLLGFPPDAEVALVTGATAESDATEGPALERIVRQNTELAVLRARYRAAEEGLRLAIRRQYPDVGLNLGGGSEQSDGRVLLGLSVPIPLWNRNRLAIAVARALRTVARVTAESAVERLVRRARELELIVAATHAQRVQLTRDLVPLLGELRTTIDRLAELGDVDAFLLLQAVQRRFDVQDRLITLEREEAEARAQLRWVTGPPEGLALTPADELPLPTTRADAQDSNEDTSR